MTRFHRPLLTRPGPARRGLTTLVASALASLALLGPGAAEQAAPAAAPRVVAIGDIHGEGPGLVAILQAAGLIDGERKWSGGTTRLVQTGDILDRGASV